MSVLDEVWNFHFDIHGIEKESFREFNSRLSTLNHGIMKLLEDEFKIDSFIYKGVPAKSHDDELKNLTEKNKQLRLDIEHKLEDLSRQQSQYENYKQDQRLLSQEIKETHEAFLMAKKYFKKFLKMYFTIESKHNNHEKQTIFIQFFTESKKDSESYSLRLLRDIKTRLYELEATNPSLPIFKELQRKLKETNDVPGVLCCIRQAFIIIRTNKKH